MTISAESIAVALDGRRVGRNWRCRCPIHDGHSLVVRDGDHSRLLVKCWSGCAARDVLTALRQLGLIDGDNDGAEMRPDPAAIERRRLAEARDRQRRIALARDMIAASCPVEGTPVERYLRQRIPGLAEIPAALRYLPRDDAYARHPSGIRRPTMVAAVEHVEHLGVVASHRTWLAIDGTGKACVDPARVSTGPIKGGAVRLGPAAEMLLVGEGIETCLAAMTATGMPAWAALSTSGTVSLALPPIARHLVILADHDVSGAGERAARQAASQWAREGREVQIFISPFPGEDAADRWLAAAGNTHRVATV